ncbi:MAG: Hsp33 family molecular chaperone HslO [Desulfomonilia bacterium]|nr:Hsp33 family molecular chaperone HslO [Desulfomonilia bacterium]
MKGETAMRDHLVRIISDEKNILGLASVTTGLVNDARLRHGTAPTATAALGRALTAGGLLGALLDPGQRVAMKFEGDGPLRKIVVEAEGDGTVSGYVTEPQVDLPPKNGKLDVSGALGSEGFLTVSKDLRIKKPYSGVVRLYSGEIASDVAFYLTESEQIPSAVGLGVFVEKNGQVSVAGGFLLQSLPPSDPELIDRLARRVEGMDPVTTQLRQNKTPEDILLELFGTIPCRVIGTQDLAFRCSCSKDRLERALLSLGPFEIERMIQDREDLHISCQFCGEHYVFTHRDMDTLLREMH